MNGKHSFRELAYAVNCPSGVNCKALLCVNAYIYMRTVADAGPYEFFRRENHSATHAVGVQFTTVKPSIHGIANSRIRSMQFIK